ncbi:MAG: hypothetical protein IJA36_12110 [Lachnospiraceae bacterium]|nr:hypothetical protein [Lachnospiraceae bacterium]
MISSDECFVRLINYKNAWISNYGRPLEFNNGKYVFKRISENEVGGILGTAIGTVILTALGEILEYQESISKRISYFF